MVLLAIAAVNLFIVCFFSITTEDDEDDDIEDDSEEKKKIALIAASCTGGFVLFVGLTLVIWTHIRNKNT